MTNKNYKSSTGKHNNESEDKDSVESLIKNIVLLQFPDLEIHSMLIQGAISVGDFNLAQELFDELVKFEMVPTKSTFSALATMYADKDDIGKIKSIINSFFFEHNMQNNNNRQKNNLVDSKNGVFDIKLFTPLLFLYISENRINEAMKVLRAWGSLYANKISIIKLSTVLIQIYRALGKPYIGVQLALDLEKAKKNSTSEKTETEAPIIDQNHKYNDTNDISAYIYYIKKKIEALLEARDLYRCIETLKEILDKKIIPDKQLIHSLLYGFLYNDSLEMFEALADFYFKHIGTHLPLPLLNFWIQELSKRGDANGAYSVIQQMIAQGAIVNEVHFCMVIQACTLRGWTNQADELLIEMQHPESPVKPGLLTFTSLIESHVAAGNIDVAEDILNTILNKTLISRQNIKPRSFNLIMIGHLCNNNGHNAIEVFQKMAKLKIKPNKYTYSILMHAFAKEKKIQEVGRILNQLLENKITPDSVIYTILINLYAKTYNIRAAESLFRKAEIIAEKYFIQRMRSQPIKLSSVMYPSKMSNRLEKFRIGINDGVYDVRETEVDMRVLDKETQDYGKNFIDPIMILAMINLYTRVKDLDKAILFWYRLMNSYPILKINPKYPEGPRMALTCDFHVSGMGQLINAHLSTLDTSKFFDSTNFGSNEEWNNNDTTQMNDLKKQEDYDFNHQSEESLQYSQSATSDTDPLTQNSIKDHNVSTKIETEAANDDGATLDTSELNAIDSFEMNRSLNEQRQESVLKLIELFENAKNKRFHFNVRHINEYISCLLLTSRYVQILHTLKACNVSFKNRPKQSEMIEKNAENLFYEYNLRKLPILAISKKNTQFLLEKLKWVVKKLGNLPESILNREEELKMRYKIISSQSKWIEKSPTDFDNTINNTQWDFQKSRPSLDDFVNKDIIMMDLQQKHKFLSNERNQLLKVVKLWSIFEDSVDIQKIATLFNYNDDNELQI
ncbi:hypothetical protein BB561_006285 [Smittium simulii]|uniref:Uncharacterized protein n=1 Tax=Smittium simulii TaxID=133385 RepID=A0A2T9Y5F8_9FUNG|nr:hypothetical protein BB561_006285 [Smittium simulii]